MISALASKKNNIFVADDSSFNDSQEKELSVPQNDLCGVALRVTSY